MNHIITVMFKLNDAGALEKITTFRLNIFK